MVENLGVSYVKTSDQYVKKLHAELSNLNFPLKTEAVSILSPFYKYPESI